MIFIIKKNEKNNTTNMCGDVPLCLLKTWKKNGFCLKQKSVGEQHYQQSVTAHPIIFRW